MVLIQPKYGIADQKGPHLVPSVIKDQAFPIGVVAPSPIGMLIKVGSIKKTKTVGIFRKMGRHPIQDHPYAPLMELIDQQFKVLWLAKTGGWCKIPCYLISPRRVKGVFHDRHELNVGKAHFI